MANVRFRASATPDAPIITTLPKGLAVEVIGSVGDRRKVNVRSLNLIGWVHKNYLAGSTTEAQEDTQSYGAQGDAQALQARSRDTDLRSCLREL